MLSGRLHVVDQQEIIMFPLRLTFWIILVEAALVVTGSLAQELGFADAPLRRGEAGFRALYTVDRDGLKAEYLVAAPGMISSATPEWSHDGKMVAFDAVTEIDDVTNSQLFVYAIEGPFKGPVRALGYGNTPSWSPDDRQIAFMLNGGNPLAATAGVWLMDADGSNRRWLCEGFYPRWSPDGKRLCCHAWLEDGTASLFVVDVATGVRRALFPPGGWELQNYGGTWSPDGNQIVFVGAWRGKDHLATVDVGANTIHVLYTNEDRARELFGPPAWSPDGRQIIFGIQQKGGGPRQWWKSYL
jgi:TolB protein